MKRASITAIAALVTAPAWSQSYPLKPVRVIVPYQAGGGADNASRATADLVSPVLGQPLVIDNRPGANGLIGMDACAKSKPDGYTLCITSMAPISQHPWLVANLPYDPPRDFAPVIHIGVQPSSMVVHPSVPASSIRELFDMARAKPDAIAWATSGMGSSGHLYHAWMNSQKIHFYHVPYKTIDQALIGVINGDVQVLVHSLGATLPHVKAGKLKLLAAGMERRTRQLPDVPSAREGGLEAGTSLWIGAFAPARTPREIIGRLNSEMDKAFASPEGRKRFGAYGIETVGGTPEQFVDFIREDLERNGQMARLAGIKPQ